jgi:hypothetical protein
VTLIRLAGQLLDDERTCVVPDCGAHAAAEPFQAELPAKADELRRKAEAYERLAEPRPTPTRNVHRQRRASPLAGV